MKSILKKAIVSFIISIFIFSVLYFIDNLPKNDGGNLFFFSFAVFVLNLISAFFRIVLLIYFFILKKTNLNVGIFVSIFSLTTLILLLSVFRFGR
jgi:hypothetical protein